MKPLEEIVDQLDPEIDEHWTADGAPRMDVLKELTGNDELERTDVIEKYPDLTRESALEAKISAMAEAEAAANAETELVIDEEINELDELDEEINQLAIQRDTAQQKISELSLRRDRLQEQKFRQPDKMTNDQAIKEYIEQQQKNRADRIAASPLQQSLSNRRKTRGSQRPNYPIKEE